MAAPVYRVDPAALRPSVALEGMTLLYHRPSGATHILLPPAPEMIAVLEEGPADAAAVIARLEAAYGADEDEEPIAAIVGARLAELIAAGLVAEA